MLSSPRRGSAGRHGRCSAASRGGRHARSFAMCDGRRPGVCGFDVMPGSLRRSSAPHRSDGGKGGEAGVQDASTSGSDGVSSTGTRGAGPLGGGSANPLRSGEYTEKIDGTSRTYVVDVPIGYDTNATYRSPQQKPLRGSDRACGSKPFCAVPGLRRAHHLVRIPGRTPAVVGAAAGDLQVFLAVLSTGAVGATSGDSGKQAAGARRARWCCRRPLSWRILASDADLQAMWRRSR